MHSTGADMTTLLQHKWVYCQQHIVCVGVLAPTPKSHHSYTIHVMLKDCSCYTHAQLYGIKQTR